MSAWLHLTSDQSFNKLDLKSRPPNSLQKYTDPQPPYVLINQSSDSWASLQVAKFHSRPAHADQLHLDLWWQGLNIAQDAGTYTYNADPPWDNSLTSALVHNTVTLDGQDFMQHAGRFLYLDWAQGKILASQLRGDGSFERLSAQHDGYKGIKVAHCVSLIRREMDTGISSTLLDGPPEITHTIRLHWLLPDWEYETFDLSADREALAIEVRLFSPHGKIGLKISSPSAQWKDKASGISFQLVRAGKILHGQGSIPNYRLDISDLWVKSLPWLASFR
jgi:hypothetical protein